MCRIYDEHLSARKPGLPVCRKRVLTPTGPYLPYGRHEKSKQCTGALFK